MGNQNIKERNLWINELLAQQKEDKKNTKDDSMGNQNTEKQLIMR
jgi:hypothetical protein